MRETGCWLIFACAGVMMLHAQESAAGSAKTVLALEQAWSEAEARGDNRTLDRIFDNALVYVEEGRMVTKGERLSSVRAVAAHARQIEMWTTKVQVFGSTAIVVGTYRGAAAKEGKGLLRRWRFIDTWVNKNGTWVLVATGSTPLAR